MCCPGWCEIRDHPILRYNEHETRCRTHGTWGNPTPLLVEQGIECELGTGIPLDKDLEVCYNPPSEQGREATGLFSHERKDSTMSLTPQLQSLVEAVRAFPAGSVSVVEALDRAQPAAQITIPGYAVIVTDNRGRVATVKMNNGEVLSKPGPAARAEILAGIMTAGNEARR